MNNDHVMVDLETADNVATAAIISIGAVVFAGPRKGREFYAVVDLGSSLAAGLTSSKETMEWWGRQSPQAQAVFTDQNRYTLDDALAYFGAFVGRLEYPRIWGNGADFDNAILQVAYRLVGAQPPWKFWNNRCYRTAMADVDLRAEARDGTYHNALDDAKTQAQRLLKYRPEVIR